LIRNENETQLNLSNQYKVKGSSLWMISS